MRFYFSFMAKTLVQDEVGKLFPSQEAALEYAESVAADCVKQGVLDGCSVVVTRNGKTLFDVPMLPEKNW